MLGFRPVRHAPRRECWNAGILENWVLDSELQDRWSAEGGTTKFKMVGIRFKTTIPSFHYSIIP